MFHFFRLVCYPGKFSAVAIDDRRITTPDVMVRTIEEDAWFGPPLTEEWLDDPNGVGKTVHRYPDGDLKREFGYDAIFALWYMSDEGKVFQIEELTYPEAELAEDLQVIENLYGLRYLHAIRDVTQGCFVHCDGAVRVYDPSSFDARRTEDMPTQTRVLMRIAKYFGLMGTYPPMNGPTSWRSGSTATA